MKKLSVVIPLYNTPVFLLEKCLNSCQGNKDIEIIVIDDGSQVDYSNIIKKYDVKYIKVQNGGVSSARNIGIQLSNAQYICFLDSDDMLININRILPYLNNNDIIITRNFILKEELIPNYYEMNKSMYIDSLDLKKDMFILEKRHIECVEPVWSKYYKSQFLKENNLLFNQRLLRGEDILFNYEAYTKASNIYYLNEYSYIYRMDNASITRSFDKIMDINTYKLLEEFEMLFKRLNINDQNYVYYVFRLIVRLIRKYFVYLSEDEYNDKIELLFSNVIINHYLPLLNTTKLDIYKVQLYNLLIMKDKVKLYDYIRDVCDKKLLKK